MSNIIKRIELDLNGTTIKLTLKQAKELKRALDEVFGETVIREYPYKTSPYNPYKWEFDSPYYFSSSDILYKCDFDTSTLKISV